MMYNNNCKVHLIYDECVEDIVYVLVYECVERLSKL